MTPQKFITLTLIPFGAFRRYEDHITPLQLPEGANLAELRNRLVAHLTAHIPGFADAALVYESAFATDQTILPPETIFDRDDKLAILPPVCGG